MRNVGRVILWVILGAVLGSAVGIIARRLGFADVSGGILGGMVSAPAILMLFLLFDYVDELIFWAIGGAIVGALLLTLLGAFGGQSTGSAGLAARFSIQTAINGALVGSVLATWLGAGALVFKRGMIGLVALLISVVAGGFLGAMVWMLGDLIGGKMITVEVLGRVNTWRQGEMIAGVPAGILAGLASSQFLSLQRQ